MANQFPHPFSKIARMYREYRRNLPADVSYRAVEFFKDSFRKQGFEDKTWIPWKPRRGERGSRRGFTDKRQGRGTLMQSGALRRSIRPQFGYDFAGAVAGGPKIPYAEIHNEGGRAGRGRKVQIPRRRFMGDSAVFLNQEEKIMYRELDKIWNKA